MADFFSTGTARGARDKYEVWQGGAACFSAGRGGVGRGEHPWPQLSISMQAYLSKAHERIPQKGF